MRVGIWHERASLAAMPARRSRVQLQALLQRARREFFRHLSEIDWTPFALALLCLLAMQLARAWAWRNVLRAAYPDKPISFLPLAAAYLAGAGINAIVPAHAGDVTKVFLVKRQIPDSSYPAVTSSFLVQTVFDTTVGMLVLLYAITQGLLPPLPRLPDLPAFEISFWAEHPKRLLHHRRRRCCWRSRSASTSSPTGCGASGSGSNRAWSILTEPRRYLREVVAWQGVGWLFRFAAFWFFLEAFGIGGSIGNVMLVMSVQAIANIVPFTPGGAGAQQALLVATLHGPSRTAVLSFSVGTQIAMAAWSVVLGFAAILLVFRTTDWRGLIRQAQEEADERQGRRKRRVLLARPAGVAAARPATARAAVRRPGTRSGCGRAGSPAGPGRGRPRAGPGSGGGFDVGLGRRGGRLRSQPSAGR